MQRKNSVELFGRRVFYCENPVTSVCVLNGLCCSGFKKDHDDPVKQFCDNVPARFCSNKNMHCRLSRNIACPRFLIPQVIVLDISFLFVVLLRNAVVPDFLCCVFVKLSMCLILTSSILVGRKDKKNSINPFCVVWLIRTTEFNFQRQ